jgi:threonylcarbamoyladenosine tRNA methylthiotransferase MtaB
MIPVFFYTLGCKLNQLETEAILCAFKDAGFSVFSGQPEQGADILPQLCIINTCTVTSKAEQKARRIIRFYLKKKCAVLVTGCYAQLEREELEAMQSGSLFVVPGMNKDSLLDLPRYLAANNPDMGELSAALAKWLEKENATTAASFTAKAVSPGGVPHRGGAFRFNPGTFTFHSRAFLKIQDGCDKACAYCRVPLARGKSVSLDAETLLRRLQALEEAGYHEAVITGVNIAQYREPQPSLTTLEWSGLAPQNAAMNLPSLLSFLLENTNSIALRLSSIEPEFEGESGKQFSVYDEAFYKAVSSPRIRNHFHLSVQSGSNAILSAMGRPYRNQHILEMAEKLRSVKNDPFLACDIITGFPGESDDDFEKTVELCRIADFAWIHVFPYSKRPGTRAALLKGQIPQAVARRRQQKLAELAMQGKQAYVRRWRGKTVEAIAETGLNALTDNYIRIRLLKDKGMDLRPGAVFQCVIDKESKERAFDAWAEKAIIMLENAIRT